MKMNYLMMETLIDEQGYEVEYMNVSYSTSLIPVVNVGLRKGEETLSFSLRCHGLENLAGEVQSLAAFINWLSQGFNKEKELKNNG